MKAESFSSVQEYIDALVKNAKAAQKIFERDYTTQRPIDEVVRAAGKSVVDNAYELCKEAVSETGMGNIEAKIAKLTGVALSQWCIVRGKNTVDYEDVPGEPGVRYLPKPMGVIGCVMPSTNPIATIIGNTMMALKCRNAVIIAPHPASAQVSVKTVDIIRAALKEIHAPEDLVQCIGVEAASVDATSALLRACDCNIATGGAGMVKSVYSSGRPGFGVGQGNCQDIVDRDMKPEEYAMLAKLTVMGRAWDNGVPCIGDQTTHIPEEMEEHYLRVMQENGAFLLTEKADVDKLRDLVFPDGGTRINRKVVGRLPAQIGAMAGIDIPDSAVIILVKNQAWGEQDVLCREILCPIMRYTTYSRFEDAVDRAVANLEVEGAGHSSAIWTHDQAHVEYAAKRIPVGRFHVNQPTMGYSNGVLGTTTIGCGTWGNNSISENLAYYHLMNKTRVTTVVPNLRPRTEAEWDNYEPFEVLNT